MQRALKQRDTEITRITEGQGRFYTILKVLRNRWFLFENRTPKSAAEQAARRADYMEEMLDKQNKLLRQQPKSRV